MWNKIKYFKKSEFGKDPEKADPRLVLLMDGLREYAGCPISIHVCHSNDGHAANSLHKQGRAVDFHFIDPHMTTLEQFLCIAAFPFNGVGFYPFWNHPGWHVDIRKSQPKKYWIRDQQDNYNYGRNAMRTLLEVGF